MHNDEMLFGLKEISTYHGCGTAPSAFGLVQDTRWGASAEITKDLQGV